MIALALTRFLRAHTLAIPSQEVKSFDFMLLIGIPYKVACGKNVLKDFRCAEQALHIGGLRLLFVYSNLPNQVFQAGSVPDSFTQQTHCARNVPHSNGCRGDSHGFPACIVDDFNGV